MATRKSKNSKNFERVSQRNSMTTRRKQHNESRISATRITSMRKGVLPCRTQKCALASHLTLWLATSRATIQRVSSGQVKSADFLATRKMNKAILTSKYMQCKRIPVIPLGNHAYVQSLSNHCEKTNHVMFPIIHHQILSTVKRHANRLCHPHIFVSSFRSLPLCFGFTQFSDIHMCLSLTRIILLASFKPRTNTYSQVLPITRES